jgi:hypothetical protein
MRVAILAALLVLVTGCTSASPWPGSYTGDLGVQLTATAGGQDAFSNVDLLVNVHDEGSGEFEGTDLTFEIYTESTCYVYGTSDGKNVTFPEQYPLCSVTDGALVWEVESVTGTGFIAGDHLTLVLDGNYSLQGDSSDNGTFTASYVGTLEPGTR